MVGCLSHWRNYAIAITRDLPRSWAEAFFSYLLDGTRKKRRSPLIARGHALLQARVRAEYEVALLRKRACAYTDPHVPYSRRERREAWNIWLRAVRVSAKPILFGNVGNIVIAPRRVSSVTYTTWTLPDSIPKRFINLVPLKPICRYRMSNQRLNTKAKICKYLR